MLPGSLRSHTFGVQPNQSLDNVTLLKSLQRLTRGLQVIWSASSSVRWSR